MVGRVPISGSKNAVLPILAACLLTDEECRLKNVPRIEDVSTMTRLLEAMGVQIRWLDPQQLQVNAQRLLRSEAAKPTNEPKPPKEQPKAAAKGSKESK